MLDGMGPPDRQTQQPATFDIRPLLPRLRVQASEAHVECLAIAAACNAIGAARWAVLMYGPGADLETILHPAPDPATPPGHAADTLAALNDAIGRHRAINGGDGLALAYDAIKQKFGGVLADHILDLLIGVYLDFGEPGEEMPPPHAPPIPANETGADEAMLGFIFGDHRLGGLRTALDHRRDTCAAGLPSSEPLVGVQVAVQRAADLSVCPEELQLVVQTWAGVTGGPQISLNAEVARHGL